MQHSPRFLAAAGLIPAIADFQGFAKQQPFARSHAKYNLAGAASRTGKTWGAAENFAERLALDYLSLGFDCGDVLYWCIGESYSACVAQKRQLLRLIPNALVDWRKQGDKRAFFDTSHGMGQLFLRGNREITLRSASNPENLTAEKVRGIWWTEIARSKRAAWPNVYSRLSNYEDSWFIADTSPMGRCWFFNEVWEPARQGKFAGAECHEWTASESPFVSEQTIEEARQNLAPEFFRREFMADWSVFQGQIYSMWNKALHVVDACPFTPERATIACDINTTTESPAAFVTAYVRGQPQREQAHIERTYYEVISLDYDRYANDIAAEYRRVAATLPTRVRIDPSFHRDFKIKLRDLGVPIENAKNDVHLGIRTMGSALTPKTWLSGKPALTISSACAREFTNEIEGYAWKSNSRGVVYDEPSKESPDHLCFAGETLVLMGDGSSKRMDTIAAGDEVMTPEGSQKVIGAGLTRKATLIVSVTIGGTFLECTSDHRFAVRPDSGQRDSTNVFGEQVLSREGEQVFHPPIEVGRARVSSPCGLADGSRANTQDASRPSQERRPLGQSPVELGVRLRESAPQRAHGGEEEIAGVDERSPRQDESRAQGRFGVAQVARGSGVAQGSRERDCGQSPDARVRMHCVWQPIQESLDSESPTMFLSLELQDEALPGNAPRLSAKVLQVSKVGQRLADVYCLSVPCGAFVLACGLVVKNCDATRYLCMDVFSGFGEAKQVR